MEQAVESSPRASLVYSPPTLAKLLEKTPGALAVMRHRGIGPPWFHIGSSVYYKVASVEEWLLRQPEAGRPHHRKPRARKIGRAKGSSRATD